MLSNQSITAATQFANSIAASGIALDVRRHGPIDLVMATMNPIESSEDDGQAVRISAQPLNSGFDPHTAEVRRTANMLSSRVAGNIKLARTVINPMIREIITLCEKRKHEIESDSPLNIRIKNVAVLPTFTSPELESMYERFKTGTFRPVTIGGPIRTKLIGAINDELLFEGLKRGNDVWNTGIAQALKEGRECCGFTEASDLLLREAELPYGSVKWFQDPTYLINFLFISSVLNGKMPSVNIEDFSITERAELAKLQAYYGNKLAIQIQTVTNFAASGNFIFIAESTRKELYVYTKNYLKWIDDGGNADALIGAVASGEESLAGVANNIKDNVERYMVTYKTLESRFRAKQRMATTTEMKGVIEASVYRTIHGTLQDEEMRTAIANAKAFFAKHPLQTNEDILGYTRRAVCRTFAAKTACLEILNDIDAFMEDNESMTIERAAVLAGVRLLAKWTASQLSVTRVRSTGPIPVTSL